MIQPMIRQFQSARNAGTPIICIRTADPAATINTIKAHTINAQPPMIHWDIVRGVGGLNKAGSAIASDLGGSDVVAPIEALIRANTAKVPEKTIVFFANAHLVIRETGVTQAIWNLRDPYKASFRTLVLLCPMLDLPSELTHDVLVLDEPLPTIGQLAEIAKDIYRSAELPVPDGDAIDRATDATCGLAAFAAEQVLAMSISKKGLDMESLWERKRQVVEQTPGLSVWRGGETFSDIGGCGNVKTFLSALLNGNEPPRAVVFLDEIN